jgi:hypothetical protein
MVNVNNIRIFVIENPDVPYLEDLGMFDYFDYGHDVFIGLAIDSTRLRDELDGIWDYSSFPINDFGNIGKEHNPILQSVLDYCGIEFGIDGILDMMLDEDVDLNRRFYLESVLYFKSNQKGKKINKIQLTIKHFDDFIHNFSEDVVSHEILTNNEDFSETIVIIETYLSDKEIDSKFSNFLIK